MRTLAANSPSKSEQLAMQFLAGARYRAVLRDGSPTIFLRTLRFVDILKSAPHLIRYEYDFKASAPQWPRFRPMYEECTIIVTDEIAQ
jgi:hypothetical protein